MTGIGSGAAAFVALLSAAPAPPAVVAWSTYLRAGPAQTAQALDEVEHDTAAAVLGCQGDWCRVRIGRTEGYLDRTALALPRAARPEGSGPCVTTGLADDRRNAATRFCTPAPPAR